MHKPRTSIVALLLPAVACALAIAASASAQQQGDRGYQDFDQGERQYRDDEYQENQYQDDQRQQDERMRRGDYGRRQDYDQRQSYGQEQEYGQRQSRNDAQSQQRRDQSGQPAGLGVSVVDGERGVRVRQLSRNSPADEAGIRIGDEILAVNDRRVSSSDQLAGAIRRLQPGTRVDLRVSRNGQQRTLAVRLETRREALEFEQSRMAEAERYFRGGPPPWGGDQLLEHVSALEWQLQQMESEIDELRSMLQNDPTRARFGDGSAQRGEGGERGFDRPFDSGEPTRSRDREFRYQD